MKRTHRTHRRREAGVALMIVLLGLTLLSAIAAGLMYVASTETAVNYNYRAEQVAYFGAKAGIEEARDRMVTANANYFGNQLPTAIPSDAGGVLYLLNEGNAPGTVKPWQSGNKYMDDELCHDGYTLTGLTSTSSDVRCTTVPTGGTWYQTVTSTAPWSGTSAALSYAWVRIALKVNNSIQNYPVNSTGAANTAVCWNGSTEVLLTAASCLAMTPGTTPVYIVTALGISPSGARKMVQMETALSPSQPFPYGLFATGTGCGAVTMTGGSTTDSFSSANGGTYSHTQGNRGDVGANGNVTLTGGGTHVDGSIGVPAATTGNCPGSDLTTSGGAGMIGGGSLTAAGPFTIPVPPAPNPVPPTTDLKYDKSGGSMVPGTYGNISVSGGGALTLAPGVYNINSISLSGNSTLTISPPGQVVLNVAGSGQNTVVDFSGGTVANTSDIANNFQINYAGSGKISLSGGSDSYYVVDAPNASASLTGGSDIFGAIAANTVSLTGGTNFHYDTNTALAPQSNGLFQVLSFRDVAY